MQPLKSVLITIVLLLIALIPLHSNPLPVPSTLAGDVDGNWKVDIMDAMNVAQYISGMTKPGFKSELADVSASGTIDITDALLIAQYSAGLLANLLILPQASGAIGTKVTVYGCSFDAKANGLYFRERSTGISYYDYQLVDYYVDSYGNRVIFTVPASVNPYCYYDPLPCAAPSKAVVPGVYDISVTTSKGSSTLVPFTVK